MRQRVFIDILIVVFVCIGIVCFLGALGVYEKREPVRQPETLKEAATPYLDRIGNLGEDDDE